MCPQFTSAVVVLVLAVVSAHSSIIPWGVNTWESAAPWGASPWSVSPWGASPWAASSWTVAPHQWAAIPHASTAVHVSPVVHAAPVITHEA